MHLEVGCQTPYKIHIRINEEIKRGNLVYLWITVRGENT
jgi:hypothetical protein